MFREFMTVCGILRVMTLRFILTKKLNCIDIIVSLLFYSSDPIYTDEYVSIYVPGSTVVRQASIDTFLYTCYLDFNLFSWIWYFGNHSFTILKSDFSMYLMPLWRRIGTCLWYLSMDALLYNMYSNMNLFTYTLLLW